MAIKKHLSKTITYFKEDGNIYIIDVNESLELFDTFPIKRYYIMNGRGPHIPCDENKNPI